MRVYWIDSEANTFICIYRSKFCPSTYTTPIRYWNNWTVIGRHFSHWFVYRNVFEYCLFIATKCFEYIKAHLCDCIHFDDSASIFHVNGKKMINSIINKVYSTFCLLVWKRFFQRVPTLVKVLLSELLGCANSNSRKKNIRNLRCFIIEGNSHWVIWPSCPYVQYCCRT